MTRAGRALRAIRRHHRWTLSHAAATAGISASVASRLENGRFNLCSFDAVEAYARGLGASADLYIRWRGGDLDRLLNRRHAAMHERMAQLWKLLPDWTAIPEQSFSIYGERGVIDWFGWHALTQTVLIEELKSQFVDVQELVATNNRRMRLAPEIARSLGWRPTVVASWVLVEDGRTNRRHLAQHERFLRTAFPVDGRAMRSWLRAPSGPIRCLSFLPMFREPKRGHDLEPDSALAASRLILPGNSDHERMAISLPRDVAGLSADGGLARFADDDLRLTFT